MKKLSKEAKESSIHWIIQNGRELEQALVKYSFMNGQENEVINALAKFQNEDGGFGHGLESDIQMPASSPITIMKFIKT
ncbi:hypothetical protein RZN22_17495 [Bacillaceae bacterium S4-13-58]